MMRAVIVGRCPELENVQMSVAVATDLRVQLVYMCVANAGRRTVSQHDTQRSTVLDLLMSNDHRRPARRDD